MRQGVYYVGESQFIFCPFSHFEMQDFKNPKNFCMQHLQFLYLNIFRFKTDAELQVHIDFNTKSKFSFSRSSFFSPLNGH